MSFERNIEDPDLPNTNREKGSLELLVDILAARPADQSQNNATVSHRRPSELTATVQTHFEKRSAREKGEASSNQSLLALANAITERNNVNPDSTAKSSLTKERPVNENFFDSVLYENEHSDPGNTRKTKKRREV